MPLCAIAYNNNQAMKILVSIVLCLALLMAAGCAGESLTVAPAATPTPEPDLGATVQAAVSAALPTETPTPTPDIDATVAAGIMATKAAAPTPTPTPPPTPNVDATVEARMAATIAAMPTPTPTPDATLVAYLQILRRQPTATPMPAPTPMPAATPTPIPPPTSTLVPRATPNPTSTPIPTKSPAALLSEMVRRARPAVVRIESSTSVGSGAIFETQGQTGYVITNHHVVEGAARVNVTVNDSMTYTGTVLGTDSVRDLAVVRICCGSFRTLTFGDASRLEPGDEVVAIGYALGLSGQATITRGIVSAMRYDSRHRSDVIQTDAAINPGNSGGPMLSMSGEILGINTYRIDESRSGRTAEGLAFAISETTVQQRIATLKTARAAPTPTPTRRPRPTPTPAYGGTDFFGPTDGELWHDPADGFIKSEYANVSMSDIIISATFINPYSAATHSWDYGFIIRDRISGPNIHVVVTSRGRWELLSGDEPPRKRVDNGTLRSFDTSVSGKNKLWLMATGERGLLFVNGDFISELDLSDVTAEGDIAVITGAFEGDEVVGAVTKFEDFQAVSLHSEYGPADGKLEYEKGIISGHTSGVWTRDFVAEAEFTNPPGSKWDYGFIIRNPEFSRLEVIGVNGDNWWFHNTRDVGDDEYTDVAEGRLGLKSKNHLLLWAANDYGLFFVNGELVARLDLSHNLDYGSVSVMGGFYNDHTEEPEFENFNVWTFPNP